MEGAIEQAIRYAAQAGKLRAYVRSSKDGLGGLERLADHMSAIAGARLTEWLGEGAQLGEYAPSPPRRTGG